MNLLEHAIRNGIRPTRSWVQILASSNAVFKINTCSLPKKISNDTCLRLGLLNERFYHLAPQVGNFYHKTPTFGEIISHNTLFVISWLDKSITLQRDTNLQYVSMFATNKWILVWNFVDTLWKWEYESHLLHMLHTKWITIWQIFIEIITTQEHEIWVIYSVPA